MENIYNTVKRFKQNISTGLTSDLVHIRKNQGLSNINTSVEPRSLNDIIKSNVFTLFNLINLILAIALLYTGSYKNLMFMGVVICNCVIGIIQEVRAKKSIDKLELITSDSVKVIRDGKEIKIRPEEVVLDDIIKYSMGDQIVTDCSVLEGECEVNESLLTGESDLICKKTGDMLLSGSFVPSGQCYARAERVGKDNYSSKILNGVQYSKKACSEIMDFLKRLIKGISFAIIPIGIMLFINQYRTFSYEISPAIIVTSSALIGMIPEGLVLLTSTAFALSVIRLSKHNILMQDIYCVETLARVDTFCLDKTGTITQGTLSVVDVIPQKNLEKSQIYYALNMITGSLKDSNETFLALKREFNKNSDTYCAKETIPFSSSRKWSGAFFEDKGCYVIGAAGFIFDNIPEEVQKILSNYAKEYRVLVLAHSDKPFCGGGLPDDLNLAAVILLKDKIRENAQEVLGLFAKQGVNIKVISGDDPMTVSGIAKEAGLQDTELFVDMSAIKDPGKLKEAAQKYKIFGRVTPQQKRDLVKALKEQKHVVAMSGDGVNDVLALKEADCSIAMAANGSDAARAVSQIILLDSEFSSLPRIVEEGRRVINNIQRASSLFLVKTIYSCILAVLFLFINVPYPFIPIQMTFISSLTIGIPSFILALEPNNSDVKKNIVGTILRNAVPFALIITVNIILSALAYIFLKIPEGQYSTMCVFLTGISEIVLLYKISLPLSRNRKLLIGSVIMAFLIAVLFFQGIFSLYLLNITSLIVFAGIFLGDLLFYRYFALKIM